MTIRKFDWIESLLRGKTLDRVPRALWRHYPQEEYDSDRFVAAVVQFHQNYPFDIIGKSMKGEDFKKFIKEHLVPELWKGAVVVMDRLRAH
ncbi:MAG: hypothetical protein VKL42_15280, partial [Snowella sp.]|nr:hypothetical protein [Snowella sp.]